jgi:hypothetical protein
MAVVLYQVYRPQELPQVTTDDLSNTRSEVTRDARITQFGYLFCQDRLTMIIRGRLRLSCQTPTCS